MIHQIRMTRPGRGTGDFRLQVPTAYLRKQGEDMQVVGAFPKCTGRGCGAPPRLSRADKNSAWAKWRGILISFIMIGHIRTDKGSSPAVELSAYSLANSDQFQG